MAFRTRTDLLADFADNSTGDIRAVNHRNFVDSVMVYGDMSDTNNTGFAVSTTPTKLPFTASNFTYGMTANLANESFDNIEQGHYRVCVDVDAGLAGNNVTYTLQLYADGAPVGNGYDYNTRDDGSRLSRSFNFAAVISAGVTSLDLRLSIDSGTQTIDIWSINWIMERMGSA